MKVIKKFSDQKFEIKINNEVFLLLQISHENILRYFEHFDHEIDGFEYTCVITEYCQVGINLYIPLVYFTS